MIKKIPISLKNITSSHDLMSEFARILGFPSYFGYNWDALYDTLNSIKTETSLIQGSRYPIKGIHFIFSYADAFRSRFPIDDLANFYQLLIDISSVAADRSGGIDYTFEMRNIE